MAGLRALVLVASIATALLGVWSGDYLHLIIMYPYYEWVISKSAEGPVRFPWGEYGSFSSETVRTLVYGKNVPAANATRETRTPSKGVVATATHQLVGDFYIETQTYD